MGRSEELRGRVRQVVRGFLDQASATLDRVATVVRDRLATRTSGDTSPPASVETVPPARPAERRESPAEAPDLHDLTKAQLYRLAQEHDIAGRSKLSKDELVEALQAEGR